MNRYFALFLSFFIGFLSLGQEMLWFRIISYHFKGIPQSFAFVLTCYLLGISIGAYIGKKICHININSKIITSTATILLIAAIVDISIPHSLSILLTSRLYLEEPEIFLGLCSILIILTASLKACIFPIAHHFGCIITNKNKAGLSMSIVYCCNIIGSTIGTICFGLIFLNYITSYEAFIYIGFSTLLVSIYLFTISQTKNIFILITYIAVFGIIGINFKTILHPTNIMMNKHNQNNVVHSLENRYGVIEVVQENATEIIKGGNVYDGKMDVDPVLNKGGLERTLIFSILHKNPKNVLVIGVSGGAWLRMLSSFPTIETIDAVELNPGYLEIIKLYPEIVPILNDPKINIHIDDGRRWLRKNSDKKYDLIMMNTTFYWRSGATNIISQEMFQLLSNSLNPNGIIGINSTRFRDVMLTAQSVFPYAYWGHLGFIYASHENFLNNITEDSRDKLYELNFNGKKLFTKGDPLSEKTVDNIINMPMKDIDKIQEESHRPLEIITDKNMINEYKYGKGLNSI